MKLQIQRLDKEVELPSYHYEHDIGLDLRSREQKVIDPGQQVVVKTGLKIALPKDHAGLIWDRSGLAAKHSIKTMGGVVDPGYRGELMVIMANLGSQPFTVEKGMKIAQLLVQPVTTLPIEEVEDLDATQRGEKGFGSSGLH